VNDPAGRGIASRLLELVGDFQEVEVPRSKEAWYSEMLSSYLVGFEEDVVEFDFLNILATAVNYFVILSRHSSASGMKSFTVHHPGVIERGEKSSVFKLPPSNPYLSWAVLKFLRDLREEYGLLDFDVTYEATHHGPTAVEKPICFVEIGSSYEEWTMKEAQVVVARAVLGSIKQLTSSGKCACTVSVGFGGSHYAPKFTARAFKLDECYGHIIPAYILKSLSEAEVNNVAKQAIRSTPEIRRVVIEKKIRKGIREAIKEVARALGLEVVEV